MGLPDNPNPYSVQDGSKSYANAVSAVERMWEAGSSMFSIADAVVEAIENIGYECIVEIVVNDEPAKPHVGGGPKPKKG